MAPNYFDKSNPPNSPQTQLPERWLIELDRRAGSIADVGQPKRLLGLLDGLGRSLHKLPSFPERRVGVAHLHVDREQGFAQRELRLFQLRSGLQNPSGRGAQHRAGQANRQRQSWN